MPKITETTFAALDTETTGADPAQDLPIEIAIARIEGWKIQRPKSWLIHPGRPIPPESSAVHHLTDEDLIGAPAMEQIWSQVEEQLEGAIIIAHNAPFDRSMLPDLAHRRWLCTLRLARKIWQKGELNAMSQPLANHQQQVLRYWLKLKIDTMGLAAHRAAADILVTGALFQEAIAQYFQLGGEDDLDALLEFLDSPTRVTHMPSGKYADVPLSEVPTEYFEFRLSKKGKHPLDSELEASIIEELEHRKASIILATRTLSPPPEV